MNTNPTNTVLLAVFLLILVSVARSTNHADHLSAFNPTAFCTNTAPFKSLCTEVIHTGLDMTSPMKVVEASVNMAVKDAHRALAEVSFLTSGRRKNYPGLTGSVLHSCKENNDSAVASLHNTLRILSGHGSHNDLMSELAAACQ
jgi:Plant invertase/pectin methylesterase inhibitor